VVTKVKSADSSSLYFNVIEQKYILLRISLSANMAKDETLELLKKKKMLELQRRLLEKQFKASLRKVSPWDIVCSVLTPKAKEILMEAKKQYPRATEKVVAILAGYIIEKRIKEIDGVTLYNILISFGIPVRLRTRIIYKSKGEVKSIRDLLKNKYD